MRLFAYLLGLCLLPAIVLAQATSEQAPLDGLTEDIDRATARVLPYPPLRSADILWEKHVWRVIDTREKINLPFRYERRPLIRVLLDGLAEGQYRAYSAETDDFHFVLETDDFLNSLSRIDTVPVRDPESGHVSLQIVKEEFDPSRIMRYRIKEIWYFDSQTSQQRVRVLGIAPLIEAYDELGKLLYERPLCWFYLPHCRNWLSQQIVYTEGNDRPLMSWDDLFEMRFFDSHISKEKNAHDRRLEDYLTGRDLLEQSGRIERTVQHREMDVWEH